MALTCSPAPPALRLTFYRVRVTRPLRSTRITRLHRYYGAVRPCTPHRYSAPCGFCRLGVSLLRSRPMRSTSLSEHRFTRSMQKPKSGSRHLYPGHRLGRKQASPRLIPSPLRCSVLMSSIDLSTRHQWFTCIRLPDSHLTSSRLA